MILTKSPKSELDAALEYREGCEFLFLWRRHFGNLLAKGYYFIKGKN